MCAGDDESDACFGDSGGFLYDSENKRLVGLTSYGDQKCLQCLGSMLVLLIISLGSNSMSAWWIRLLPLPAGFDPLPISINVQQCSGSSTLNPDYDSDDEPSWTLYELVSKTELISSELRGVEANENHDGTFYRPIDHYQCYRFEIFDSYGDDIDLG